MYSGGQTLIWQIFDKRQVARRGNWAWRCIMTTACAIFFLKLPIFIFRSSYRKALNWDCQKLNYYICLFETFKSSLYFLRQWTADVANRLLSNRTDVCQNTVRIINYKYAYFVYLSLSQVSKMCCYG